MKEFKFSFHARKRGEASPIYGNSKTIFADNLKEAISNLEREYEGIFELLYLKEGKWSLAR